MLAAALTLLAAALTLLAAALTLFFPSTLLFSVRQVTPKVITTKLISLHMALRSRGGSRTAPTLVVPRGLERLKHALSDAERSSVRSQNLFVLKRFQFVWLEPTALTLPRVGGQRYFVSWVVLIKA